MSRKERLLKKFLQHPQSLKYREIESILLNLGFSKRMGKGSHCIFFFPDFSIIVTIPIHNDDCLPVYKKELAKIIIKFFT